MKYIKNTQEFKDFKINEGWEPGLGTNLEPNDEEIKLACGLKSLFDFPTEISFIIYDFGKGRFGNINISAEGEKSPNVIKGGDIYGRGPNSIKLINFAWNELPKGENQWYDGGNGFYMPLDKVRDLMKIKNIDYINNFESELNLFKSKSKIDKYSL